ncbi:MAG TPA: hypothetical protein PKB14_06425 [Rubrivivax sp.]|nr:hypothetical protein [Rubrivivax sp.]
MTGQYEFVIVGSQSILGPVPNPEADIYPLHAPEHAGRAGRGATTLKQANDIQRGGIPPHDLCA